MKKLLFTFSIPIIYLINLIFVQFFLINLISSISIFLICYFILNNPIRFGINSIFLTGFAYFMFLYPLLFSYGLIEIPGYNEQILLFSVSVSFIALFFYLISFKFFLNQELNNIKLMIEEKRKLFLSEKKYFFLFYVIVLYVYFTFFGQGIFNKDLILFTSILFFIYATPKKHYFILSIIFIIFLILTLQVTSGRRDILKMALVFILFLQLYHGNLSIFVLSIFGIITTMSMIIITALRSFSINWSYDRDIEIIDLFNNPIYLDRVLRGYGDYLQNALVLADFGVAYNNFLFILKNIGEIGYLYGQSIFKIFYTWIPRSLWPGKPLDVQMQIVNFNTNPYYAGGTSQSMTLVGEAYWNLGIIAIILFFSSLGFINKYIERNFYIMSPYTFLIFISLAPFFILMWRGAFTTTLVYTLSNILILLLCLILSKISINPLIEKRHND